MFDERYKKELSRITTIMETAISTGTPQLVNKWQSVRNDKIISTVRFLAMPDGTLQTYDVDDRLPLYEGE